MCRSSRLTTGTRKNDSAMPMANTNRACPADRTTTIARPTPSTATTNGRLSIRMLRYRPPGGISIAAGASMGSRPPRLVRSLASIVVRSAASPRSCHPARRFAPRVMSSRRQRAGLAVRSRSPRGDGRDDTGRSTAPIAPAAARSRGDPRSDDAVPCRHDDRSPAPRGHSQGCIPHRPTCGDTGGPRTLLRHHAHPAPDLGPGVTDRCWRVPAAPGTGRPCGAARTWARPGASRARA